jgi:hypothetical protein
MTFFRAALSRMALGVCNAHMADFRGEKNAKSLAVIIR